MYSEANDECYKYQALAIINQEWQTTEIKIYSCRGCKYDMTAADSWFYSHDKLCFEARLLNVVFDVEVTVLSSEDDWYGYEIM